MPIVTDNEAGGYGITYYDVSLLKETMSMNYTCTYEQLKRLVDFVNAYTERMNIESITVSYDAQTGNLTGDMTLNLFAVTGTEKEYVAPEINDLSLGETNIFQQ